MSHNVRELTAEARGYRQRHRRLDGLFPRQYRHPVPVSSSVTPERNTDESVQVTSNWTLKSSSKRGSTSRSRVAEVTLWTTSSTLWLRPRVAQRAESSPTGTPVHPAPATASPARLSHR
ncbi:hypothetical protein [Streptomyces sp. NBC_01451]|uniref:hypothetical protein n=1 Tax=Streptomyces sp. NBC_01451 TaxID=2903872 RepID=UPI002E337353|nr:hypothetical protein [Streptomyces sp. NBC_01451]